MPKSIIAYDKDLPEIPGRRPWEKPTSFLVKDPTAESGWRVDESGRRPSKLLLVQKLRTAVDHWREDGYAGASDVTQRLFAYWFEEDHEVAGFSVPFRYHFCQREAIEALVYLVEVAQIRGQKVILRGESTEPDASGNLFLTNIHQLYETREQVWTPQNAIEALLGRKPVKDLATSQRSMLERLKEIQDLVVINDEAHHIHEVELRWSQSLLGIHRALPHGLALWLDFSATPKDQRGMYFPWTVCDSPLAQAVEDCIVKAPIIVTREDDPKQPAQDPDHITRENVCEKYGYWIQAAVQRWQEHDQTYRKLGTRPVLFIMAEKNIFADAIGAYLWQTKEFGFKEAEVLVIHTDAAGEITKRDLEKAVR